MLLDLLGRLLLAVLWVPLLLCRPFIRWSDRRRRQAARRRAHANAAARKVPLGIPIRREPSPDDDDASELTAPAPFLTRLVARPKAPPEPPAPPPDRTPAMRAELARVLDEEPLNRRTYKHLARFERKFGEAGLDALERIPVADLRRALRDFEGLVRNWSSAPLAELRSRMSVVLTDRSSAASMWVTANSVQSAFRSPGA